MFARGASAIAHDATTPTVSGHYQGAGTWVSLGGPTPSFDSVSFADVPGEAEKIYPPAETATAAEKAAFKKPNRLWPYAFLVLLALAIVLYTLVRARVIVGAFRRHRFTRGWFLRSKPASHRQRATSSRASASAESLEELQPLPVARSTPRIEAIVRGWYNYYLLPTIPWLNLTIGQCLVLLIYLGVVFAATFAQADNVVKNPNRVGRVAVAQFPLLFLLSQKNNLLSPFVGKSYVKLNFLHRFVGRCITVVSILHAAIYINRYIDERRLALTSEHRQQTGLAALIAVLIIFLTSLRPVRNYAYRFFLLSHVAGWIAFVVAVYYHADWAQPWIIASLAIFGFDYVVRLLNTRIKTAKVVPRAGDITQISVEGLQSGWGAGQHVWVRRLSAKHAWEVHPFTIASSADYVPDSQPVRGLTLYSKNCGDWTRKLYQAAGPSSDELEKNAAAAPSLNETASASSGVPLSPGNGAAREDCQIRMAVDGPYGAPCSSLEDAELVMLVAGGSGVTCILNALEEIIANSAAGRCAIARVRVVYVVRGLTRNRYFVDLLGELLLRAQSNTRIQIDMLVFDSDASQSSTQSTSESQAFKVEPKREAASHGETSARVAPVILRSGRPDVTVCLDELLKEAAPPATASKLGAGVVLLSCGPAPLIRATRRAAGKCRQDLAYRAGGITVHSETFGW